MLLRSGCCSPLSPNQKHAIQRTEPATVSQPGGAAEPRPVSPLQRETLLTDQEECHHRRLQGDQPGAGAGHQWQGA